MPENMKTDESDRIVYVVVSNPGGADGKDNTDKGGEMLFASYNKITAHNNAKGNTVEAHVVNVTEARKEALAKINVMDLLVLDMDKNGKPLKPETVNR